MLVQPVIRMNEPSDLEKVQAVPVPLFESFYYFPDDPRIAVSRDSEVLKVKTGKIIQPSTSTDDRGRTRFTIQVVEVGGESKAYALSRVLARTFVGRPSRHLDKDFSSLQVNHINGNHCDNQIDNLEWVTGSENSQHAAKLNLSENCRAVLSRNLVTGEIIRYHSVNEFSRVHEVSKHTIFKHLNKGLSGRSKVNDVIVKYDDGTFWTLYPDELVRPFGRKGGADIDLAITHLPTERVTLVSGYQQAVEFTGIKYGKIHRLLTRHGVALFGDFRIERYTDWRKVYLANRNPQ